MAETVQWRGFRELEQNLKLLGAEVHEKGVKHMMSRASVPMRDDAKARAPVLRTPDERRTPGTLRKSIAIWRKKGTQYAVTYYVGVRKLSGRAISGFKRLTGKQASENPNDPFYWMWVELGTAKMRPQPFLRPAFESKKMESVRVALEEGREFIRRTALKFKRIR